MVWYTLLTGYDVRIPVYPKQMEADPWDDDRDWDARYEVDPLPVTLVDSKERPQDPKAETDQVEATEMENCDQTRAVLGDQCAICLQALDDPVMIQDCHHVYCRVCLSSWVHNLVLHGLREPTCPLCKRTFCVAYANVVSATSYDLIYYDGRSFQQYKAQDGVQRRAMIYANRMRLVRVNGVVVDREDPLPMPVKSAKREYSEWIERELRACIGPNVDLTVLIALIETVLGSPVNKRADWRALEDTLEPFLLDDTVTFVREVAYYLSSRLNMQAYDNVIEYCCANDASTPCTIVSCAVNHSI